MQEIEKKFLLWEDGVDFCTPSFFQMYPSVHMMRSDIVAKGVYIDQGYLPLSLGVVTARILDMDYAFQPVEARVRKQGRQYFFTLKSEGHEARGEKEREIGTDLFFELWEKTLGKRIRKKRLKRRYGENCLEFDDYMDRDLLVAEIEVTTLEQAVALAPLGKDVTSDPRYKNKNLAK